MSAFPMPWDFALILIVLAVLVPWRGAVKMHQLFARPSLDTADRLSLYASTLAFQWFAVAVALWRCHARGVDFRTLGIALPDAPLVAAVTAALSFLLLGQQLLGLRRFARLPVPRQGFLHQMATKVFPQNFLEALAFAALVASVALCEEFIYRGFALAALAHAVGDSLLLGTLASSALFAIAHAYQGRRGMFLTFAVGLLFAGVRTWTGSLIPSIAAHLCTDLVAGLAAPRILRSAAPAEKSDSEPRVP
jgi:membrane protease YdiL (CAAX protease family)